MMYIASGIGVIVLMLFFAGTAGAFTGEGGTAYSAKVIEFAGAIAYAEGYWDRNRNVLTRNIPARNNNPGDFLGQGDSGSRDGYALYGTPEAGWERLYSQLQMIVDGSSHVYSLDMSISDMSQSYTTTQQISWASNVANFLGVDRSTQLREVLT
jgi:hypothetical protein